MSAGVEHVGQRRCMSRVPTVGHVSEGFGHRPQGRGHIPPLRRVQGGQRSSTSITGISRCRPLGYTTRRWRLRQPRQKVVPRWHQGSLVQVGHRCASLSFDGCATPFFLEVIPLAPLVSARTHPSRSPASSRALRSAICSRYRATSSGGQTRWIETQPLGPLRAEPLVLIAASHYASSSSVRCASCRPFTERRSCPHGLVLAASSSEPPMNLGLACRSSCATHSTPGTSLHPDRARRTALTASVGPVTSTRAAR